MSSPAWELERCPKCLGVSSVDLSDGRRLCLSTDCRHEWDPATTDGPLDDATDGDAFLHGIAVGAGIDDGTDELDMIEAARALYVGRDVLVYELEAIGECRDVDDDGYATIVFGSGFTVSLEPDEFGLVEVDDVPDAAVAAIAGTSVTLAAQVIRAGAAAMNVDEPEWKLGLTPENWLPMDADAIPVIEHGASYAIAMVALYAKIPPEQLLDLAEQIDNAATAAKEATGHDHNGN